MKKVQRNLRHIAALCGAAFTPLWSRKRWHTVWVVNAGDRKMADAYLPRWAQDFYKYRDPAMIAGLFHAPGAGTSLVCGSILTNRELSDHPELLQVMMASVCRLRAKRISFAGIIPSLLHKHDLWPDDPRLIRDQKATRFMLLENLREIQRHHGARSVCVVGVGHTGTQIAHDFAAAGFDVCARDVRDEAADQLVGVRFVGMDAEAAAAADVVTLLSTDGDSIISLLPHLRPGQVVLADTHPKMRPEIVGQLHAQGVVVYESALTYPGLRFLPKMPHWRHDTIPGCVGQAFVEASPTYDPALTLDDNARKVLRARLDRPESSGEQRIK